ncbi:MAG: CooT family nickel-binding protein [Candidatus Bathyarchaeota archaeon]|nr:CooT family nickel-binding protein [Candidatus Bathyarchaeota archaeon]
MAFKTNFITKLTLTIVKVGRRMCEFTVILNEEVVFKDAVYAKMERNKVIVRDVLGETKEIKNCKIVEVDVNSTRPVLSRV